MSGYYRRVPYPTELDLERGAWAIVGRAEQRVPPDVPVTSLVRSGDPAVAVAARAEQGGHDLVVIGSRGHGWLASLFLGSVSRDVAARSSVPVRVVSATTERGRAAEKSEQREVHAGAPVNGHAKPAVMGRRPSSSGSSSPCWPSSSSPGGCSAGCTRGDGRAGAPALQPDAGDPDDGGDRVRFAADDGSSRPCRRSSGSSTRLPPGRPGC